MTPAPDADDADLVRRTLKGDSSAFEALASRHQGMVRALVARHASRASQEIDDLTQQALVTAYRKLDHLKDPSRFEAWLWGITSRVCWKWSSRQRGKAKAASLEISAPLDAPSEDHALRDELRHRIAHALAALAPEYQEVMLLRYLEGLEQAEIASLTERTEGSVRGILQRGTKLLRDQLVSTWNELYPHHQLDAGTELPARIEELLATDDAAVMIIGEQHEIVAVNAPYSQHFGFAEKDVIGRKCYEVSHGRSSPCSGHEHPCPMELIGRGARQVSVVHHHKTSAGEDEEVDVVSMPVDQHLTSGRERRFYVEVITRKQA